MEKINEQCGDYSRLATIFLIVVRSKNKLTLSQIKSEVKNEHPEILNAEYVKQV